MAQINTKVNITAPDVINVDLIRADYASTSSIFRICFEIFLALFSVILGHFLSINRDTLLPIHWLSLAICGIATAAFLWLTFWFDGKSRVKKT